jgi:hypothetical protein
MGETLSFAPRKAIKSQVLADFLAEWVDTQLPIAPIQAELWTMYFDGSLMKPAVERVGRHVGSIQPHHGCAPFRLRRIRHGGLGPHVM